MERTEVFELQTEEEVAEFCRQMMEAKELAPVSLRYTVALTVHRAVKVRQLYDPDDSQRGPIEAGFRKLIRG